MLHSAVVQPLWNMLPKLARELAGAGRVNTYWNLTGVAIAYG